MTLILYPTEQTMNKLTARVSFSVCLHYVSFFAYKKCNAMFFFHKLQASVLEAYKIGGPHNGIFNKNTTRSTLK